MRRQLIPVAAALAGVLFCSAPPAEAQYPSVSIPTASEGPGNDPAEPIRDKFSMEEAVRFLDNAVMSWHNDRGCFACHTDYAYLYTRPLVSWNEPVHRWIRAKLEDRAENPRDTRHRVTEAVMTAVVLAQNDALTTGKLHQSTRKALDRMWTVQRADGGFDWMKFAQPPSEIDDHYGATMAAIGVGAAPEGYAKTPAARAGLEKIRKYLKDNPPSNLHHRAMVFLASLKLEGLMTASERSQLIRDLSDLQKPDGGWGLATYAGWQRSDGKVQDTASSDGYGTGFAVYVLRRASISCGDPRVRKGIAWLKANQRTSGRWFTRSLWKDQRHYLTHHGTAYAVRALACCEKF